MCQGDHDDPDRPGPPSLDSPVSCRHELMTRQAVITHDGQGCDGDTQGATGTLRRRLIHLQGWEGFQEERAARLGQLGEEWEWGMSWVEGTVWISPGRCESVSTFGESEAV